MKLGDKVIHKETGDTGVIIFENVQYSSQTQFLIVFDTGTYYHSKWLYERDLEIAPKIKVGDIYWDTLGQPVKIIYKSPYSSMEYSYLGVIEQNHIEDVITRWYSPEGSEPNGYELIVETDDEI